MMSLSLGTLFNGRRKTAKNFTEQIKANGFLGTPPVEESKQAELEEKISYVLKILFKILRKQKNIDKMALLLRISTGKPLVDISGLFKKNGENKEIFPGKSLGNHIIFNTKLENYTGYAKSLTERDYVIGIIGENGKLTFAPVEKFFE